MATETGEGTADADDVTEESAVETSEESGVDTTADLDEEESPYDQFERSLIVTMGSTLFGIVTAFVSALYVSDPESSTALLLVAAAVFLQFPIYRLVGLDVDDFGIKGNLYIAVMTFALWFITYSIVLTTGAIDAL